jgi:hypothetical protein
MNLQKHVIMHVANAVLLVGCRSTYKLFDHVGQMIISMCQAGKRKVFMLLSTPCSFNFGGS